MKAIITVIGGDKVGIIAKVSNCLAEGGINIEDVNQTIMGGHFTMMMLVDFKNAKVAFDEVRSELKQIGKSLELSVRIQREEIFQSMHQL